MSVLVIGPEQQAAIKAALDRARANIIPWEVLKRATRITNSPMLLTEGAPGFERPASEHIMLGTYLAAVSFEEQPAGIFKHLSVSSHNPKMVPGPVVMGMVCEAFGFSATLCEVIGGPNVTAHPTPTSGIWLEEFDPGHMAVNVLELEPH